MPLSYLRLVEQHSASSPLAFYQSRCRNSPPIPHKQPRKHHQPAQQTHRELAQRSTIIHTHYSRASSLHVAVSVTLVTPSPHSLHFYFTFPPPLPSLPTCFPAPSHPPTSRLPPYASTSTLLSTHTRPHHAFCIDNIDASLVNWPICIQYIKDNKRN